MRFRECEGMQHGACSSGSCHAASPTERTERASEFPCEDQLQSQPDLYKTSLCPAQRPQLSSHASHGNLFGNPEQKFVPL